MEAIVGSLFNSKCVDHTKMKEGSDDKWNNRHKDLLAAIAERLDLPGKIKFSTVSKSWKSATYISEEPLPKAPYLLLAEVNAAAPTVDDDEEEKQDDSSDDDVDDDDSSDEENHNDHVDGDEDINSEVHGEGNDEVVNEVHGNHEIAYVVNDQGLYSIDEIANDQGLYSIDEIVSRNNERNKGDEVNSDEVINTRGIFCLSTAKTYNIELPEASGKLILGTNKGWLLTLGRDLKINLLHPFAKRQLPLPPMLTFPTQYVYDDDFTPESCFDMFIIKVAMSSTIPTSDDNHRPLPVVMAIYGEMRILGFARPGDEQWVDVNFDSGCFEDIAFHKNKFYAVNCEGVFMCEIADDDGDKRGPRGTKIASIPLKDRTDTRWYLVESSSGHDLLLIARIRKGCPYQSRCTRKYYTSKFLLWKMERSCSKHDELCNWISVTNLGNESLFVGKTSSFLICASETIKRNSIYFTDDSEFFGIFKGCVGGHDMGIFSMEHQNIESHFKGKSRHPFSPPLWYI